MPIPWRPFMCEMAFRNDFDLTGGLTTVVDDSSRRRCGVT